MNNYLLFLAATALFLFVLEFGFRLGYRRAKLSDEAGRKHITELQAALLGLLALLLGFNFAMAASRFDERKALLQEEVDAIRTTYLRAQLLSSHSKSKISNLLQNYVDSRIEFLRAGIDPKLLDKANFDASQIEDQLWSVTNTMVAEDPNGLEKNSFIQSLNDMVNVNEKRRAALDNHVPEVVIYVLFTVAVGAIGFIAYGYGLTGTRRHISTAIFACLIALVLMVILDLDQPRSGFIRVGEENMLRLREAIQRRVP